MIKEKSIKGECPSCASVNFIVREVVIREGIIEGEKPSILWVYSPQTKELLFACKSCGKEINQEHFEAIEYKD